MRRSKEARLMWGKRMAQGRENARLARALETSREQDGQVGQFLVLGFGGPIRLLEFRARGHSMRVVDAGTKVEERIGSAMVWKLARVAMGKAIRGIGSESWVPAGQARRGPRKCDL